MDYGRKRGYGGAGGLMIAGLILALVSLASPDGLPMAEIGIASFVIGLALLLLVLFTERPEEG